jgi:hypothetical protein
MGKIGLIAALLAVVALWGKNGRTQLAQDARSPRGEGGSMGNDRLYNPDKLTDAQRRQANVIADVAYSAGLNPAFMIALAVTESSLRPEIVGDDGVSIGLFQLQLATAREVAPQVSKADLLDGFENAFLAGRVLKLLHQRYPGHTWAEYAEAWTLGGRGRFVLNRTNAAKVRNMARAIADLELSLDLNEAWL